MLSAGPVEPMITGDGDLVMSVKFFYGRSVRTREDSGFDSRRAYPCEFREVEAHSLCVQKLGIDKPAIKGPESEPIRLCLIIKVIGSNYAVSAGHTFDEHYRVARYMLGKMLGEDTGHSIVASSRAVSYDNSDCFILKVGRRRC